MDFVFANPDTPVLRVSSTVAQDFMVLIAWNDASVWMRCCTVIILKAVHANMETVITTHPLLK